jgi:predicted dehydrogenase
LENATDFFFQALELPIFFSGKFCKTAALRLATVPPTFCGSSTGKGDAMKKMQQVSRRQFLGGVLAAAVAPQFIPCRVLGGPAAPSKTIQLGHIGTGGQGTGLLRNFLSVENARSVAIADPYQERRERAGKDVYIEKPLGHTLNQNRAMLTACRKENKIFQYGTQQRSQELLKRGIELVLNGYIGPLERIEVWAPQGRGGGSLEEIPVPAGLDYDLYIGPAPMRPCSKDRLTSLASYHCSDYSIGFIAGWGAHPLDIAIWGLDYDQQGPVSFRGKGEFPTPDALFNTCATWDVEIKFTGGLPMRFMSTNHAVPIVTKYRTDVQGPKAHFFGDGTTFFGPKGWISLSRGGVCASNPDWFKLKRCDGTKRVLYHNRYYKSFVDSVRDRSPSIAPIEDAVRSDALSHLALLAIKSGGEVVWDPKEYKIVSPDGLNAQMTHPVRGAWQQS